MVVKDTGLICPDNLPDNLLEDLNHGQIEQMGYFLFAQLVKQRDASFKAVVKEVVEWIEQEVHMIHHNPPHSDEVAMWTFNNLDWQIAKRKLLGGK